MMEEAVRQQEASPEPGLQFPRSSPSGLGALRASGAHPWSLRESRAGKVGDNRSHRVR